MSTTPELDDAVLGDAVLLDEEPAAVDFLRRLRPNGPWTITAIVPDGQTTNIDQIEVPRAVTPP